MIENASSKEIERELARLRDATGDEGPTQRTRVMNHVAWVPERWVDAAQEVLAGLEERYPSRVIVLYPRPDDKRNSIDADVDLRCFARGKGGTICAEVIQLHLRGERVAAPASVVEPLLTADLTDFLRWRGELPFGEPELEQLAAIVDRLIVDSREWRDPDAALARLPELFERTMVSDIAWRHMEPWREAIARLWPRIADASRVRVAGPRAEALLLAGWLSGRLGRDFKLEHEPAGELELVDVDGEAAVPGRIARKSPSDLLSDELDIFWRDPIYEEAVRSFSRVPI